MPTSATMARGLAADRCSLDSYWHKDSVSAENSSNIYYSPYSSMGVTTQTELPASICERIDPKSLTREPYETLEKPVPGRQCRRFPSSTINPPTCTTNPLCHGLSNSSKITTHQDSANSAAPATAYVSAVQPSLAVESHLPLDSESSTPDFSHIFPPPSSHLAYPSPRSTSQLGGALYQNLGQESLRTTISSPPQAIQEQALENINMPWQGSGCQDYSGTDYPSISVLPTQNRQRRSRVIPPVPRDCILPSSRSSPTGRHMRTAPAERTRAFSREPGKSGHSSSNVPHLHR